MPSSGLPIPSCSAKISAFLRILLIFPAVPNSPPKNAAEKTAKNSSFHITIIIFKVTVLRHASWQHREVGFAGLRTMKRS